MEGEIRFVIVEDEPLILQQLEYSICACSPRYRVVGKARNGKDGLQEIQKHQPDIVITDIQMPILSGLDMIAQARENGLGGRYLILSGYGEFQYAQSALRLGVEDYLLKPIDPDDLELQLKSLTEKVAQGKENDFAAYVRQWFNLDIRPRKSRRCRRERSVISSLQRLELLLPEHTESSARVYNSGRRIPLRGWKQYRRSGKSISNILPVIMQTNMFLR